MKVKKFFKDIKYKLKDIKYKIIYFFINLRRWFSYCKVLFNVYDFDYSSILEVEKYQITRVRDAVIKFQNHLYWERDIRYMNLALKLLDIISGEDDSCEWVSGGFIFGGPNEDGFSAVKDETVWEETKYVNIRNAKRFEDVSEDLYVSSPIYKNSLRQEKAWQLYHKLRVYIMRSWWD